MEAKEAVARGVVLVVETLEAVVKAREDQGAAAVEARVRVGRAMATPGKAENTEGKPGVVTAKVRQVGEERAWERVVVLAMGAAEKVLGRKAEVEGHLVREKGVVVAAMVATSAAREAEATG